MLAAELPPAWHKATLSWANRTPDAEGFSLRSRVASMPPQRNDLAGKGAE